MTRGFKVTRRGLPRLLFGIAAFGIGSAVAMCRAAGSGPRDQGIGGTGASAMPDRDFGDRGIGGTGVIGTIRRFGSIVVNDLRIAYPASAVVTIDDEPARPSDLKLGQVVAVLARHGERGLSTDRIEVTSEVVGPIDVVEADRLVVLGQTVLPPAPGATWRIGEHVAVAGLRRIDGTIVASLIEKRKGAAMRVAGPVRLDAEGDPAVGALKLRTFDRRLLGRRLVLIGIRSGAEFDIAQVRETAFVSATRPHPKNLLLEAYVEHAGAGLILGSGLSVHAGAALPRLPRRGAVRAILHTNVGRSGELTVESIRVEPSRSAGHGGAAGGQGPAGQGPAEQGPAGQGPAGQGPAGQGPAGQGPAGQGPAGQGPAGQGPAGQGPAGQGPAGQGPAGQGPAGQGPAGQGPAAHANVKGSSAGAGGDGSSGGASGGGGASHGHSRQGAPIQPRTPTRTSTSTKASASPPASTSVGTRTQSPTGDGAGTGSGKTSAGAASGRGGSGNGHGGRK